MIEKLPTDFTAVLDWEWSDWKPYFASLADAPLTADNISQWLQDYDHLTRLFREAESRIEVDAMVDTTDEMAAARKRNFKQSITPEAEAHIFQLDKKLVDSELAPDELAIPLRDVRAQIRLYRDENLRLKVKLAELDSDYNRLAGAQTVEWEGEELTLAQLGPFLKDPDRDVRKKAWLLYHERLRQDREPYNALWREYMQVRKQIFQNADLSNYREYAWLDRGRHDYTPEDVAQFLESIEQVVVPALARLREKHRARLDYETLRPWDTSVDPLQRDPLRPFETMDEFIDTTSAIFHQVDPALGEQFDVMKDHQMLDLDSRKGKGPGGFCQTYLHSRRPFIFMNAVGLDGDVRTLLHEAGHAFHGFSKLNLNYAMQVRSPSEFNEVAAMAMELLPLPYITNDKSGFFSQKDAARYTLDQLRLNINFWPYMAVVVAFQHWIYAHHDEATDPANCDTKWRELWDTYFGVGVNWDGYEDYVVNFWRRQLHIFRYPFYYVEYGLAQLGAVQVWANALQDQQNALEQYRAALALGGTAKLPDLYTTAGVKFAFDVDTLGEAVALLESQIEAMEALDG